MKTIKNIVIMVLIIGMFSLLPNCGDGGGGDEPPCTGPECSEPMHNGHPFKLSRQIGEVKYCNTCGFSFDNTTGTGIVDFQAEGVWRKIGYKGFDSSGNEVASGGKPGILIKQNNVETHKYILGENSVVKGTGLNTTAITGGGNNIPINSIHQMQELRWKAAQMDSFTWYTNTTPLEKFWGHAIVSGTHNYIAGYNPAVKFDIVGRNLQVSCIPDGASSPGALAKYHFIAINSDDVGYLYLYIGDPYYVYNTTKTLFIDLQDFPAGYDKYVIPERHYYSFSLLDSLDDYYRASIKL